MFEFGGIVIIFLFSLVILFLNFGNDVIIGGWWTISPNFTDEPFKNKTINLNIFLFYFNPYSMKVKLLFDLFAKEFSFLRLLLRRLFFSFSLSFFNDLRLRSLIFLSFFTIILSSFVSSLQSNWFSYCDRWMTVSTSLSILWIKALFDSCSSLLKLACFLSGIFLIKTNSVKYFIFSLGLLRMVTITGKLPVFFIR